LISQSSFVAKAREFFNPLMSAFGFDERAESGYSVRFEKSPLFVELRYDPRSRELVVWIGDGYEDEPPFELADLLRASGAPPEAIASVELMQPSEEPTLTRMLDHASQLLEAHGAGFLTDEEGAFGRARRVRSDRAERYTALVRSKARVAAADRAWRDKDYGRVHDLLNPIRDALDQEHLRRLAFAEKHL
jgi:hypothetical protein